MKKQLMALLAKKSERKAALNAQAEKATDVAEVRGIITELDSLNEEIRSLQAMIDAVPDENAPNERTDVVNTLVPGIVPAAITPTTRTPEDDQLEYRKAFMQYVMRGTPIPPEVRLDASTVTGDVGSVIPTVIVNRIVETMEKIGVILPLVNKTSFAAGVNIPTSTLKPVATWVNEGAGSDRQKKSTSYISFSYFKLRCEISMSMEVGTLALAIFEVTFTRQVAEAMVKAIEIAIVSTANGATSCKGILAETPTAGQALTAAAPSYDGLIAAESALPEVYENGTVWCMSKKTFMAYYAIKDAEGQPIGRINYGITGKPERVLLGRPVLICDLVTTYTAALANGTIFAFMFNFADYTLNTIYDMGIQKKQDWDTEDLLTKAVMSVDGKVVDKGSLVTIAKA